MKVINSPKLLAFVAHPHKIFYKGRKVIIMEKIYSVYKHTNKETQKSYIGMSKDPISRWANGEGYRNQTKFYDDILKYGWNGGFTHEILYSGLEKEEAHELELKLIREYKDNTYNTYVGKEPEEDKRLTKVCQYDLEGNFIKEYESCVAAAKEFNLNPFTITFACNGTLNTCVNSVWRYGEPVKKIEVGKLDNRLKEVDQYTKSGEFVKHWNSMSEAGKTLGINISHISEVCRGSQKRKSAGGYVWRFAE